MKTGAVVGYRHQVVSWIIYTLNDIVCSHFLDSIDKLSLYEFESKHDYFFDLRILEFTYLDQFRSYQFIDLGLQCYCLQPYIKLTFKITANFLVHTKKIDHNMLNLLLEIVRN